jgi:SAM-dependent methyltransferase
MELVTGFWASKVLAVANGLDLFTYLSDSKNITALEFSQRYNIQPRPSEMLLTACVALGLLKKHEDRYANSQLSDYYLVRGKPLYFGGWIEMADRREYPAWMKLREALYNNCPQTWDPNKQSGLFDGEDPDLMHGFWEAMYALSVTTAHKLLDVIDFSTTRRLLDVGGGGAAFDIIFCNRYPQLKAAVYDLPFVCALTRPKIEKAGLAKRIDLIEGDFFADPDLPSGHEVILLSRILLDWNEDDCQLIISKCYSALPPGGRLIICDQFINDRKDGPVGAALMSLNMLIETWGRNYTGAEYRAWLKRTGFTRIETVRFNAPAANGAVIGYKSALEIHGSGL